MMNLIYDLADARHDEWHPLPNSKVFSNDQNMLTERSAVCITSRHKIVSPNHIKVIIVSRKKWHDHFKAPLSKDG